MTKIGIYPGTFDPMTNGHLNIIQRSLKVVDKLIIGVADNLNKKPLLSIDERKNIIANDIHSLQQNNKNIEIHTVNGLLTEFAKKCDANCIIRGLRAVSDFEYEFQLATMNRSLAPDIESIFLTPKESLIYVSSSLIKEISDLKGDISKFVHPKVEQALKAKLQT